MNSKVGLIFDCITTTFMYLIASFDLFRYRMHLYNLTLQRATGITCAVHGNFSGSKLQEVIVARGKILELLRHDPNTGKIYPVLTQESFGIIRSLMPFRLTGGTKGKVFSYLLQSMLPALSYILHFH